MTLEGAAACGHKIYCHACRPHLFSNYPDQKIVNFVEKLASGSFIKKRVQFLSSFDSDQKSCFVEKIYGTFLF
jgi:hypothetical protein